MNNLTKKAALVGFALIFVVNGFLILHAKKQEQPDIEYSMQMDILDAPMKREDQIILRLANNHRPDYPTSVACDYFAELVEERTGGRIRILNYHSAQLADEKSSVLQVMYGGIDLARVSTALLTDYNPELILLQLPYLYEDSEHMWSVLESPVGDTFLESLNELGLEGLCWYDAGARNFYTTETPITCVKDLKGLRIRVQESAFMADVIRSLGAVPVEISFDKVGIALKRGEIDGAENNLSSYISTGNYMQAKNISLDEHIRIPEVIIMNGEVFAHLSEEDQEIIRQAARDSSLKQRELWEEQEKKDREMIEKNGTIIWKIMDKQEFVEKVQRIYQKYGGDYEEVLKEIRSMRRKKE